MERGAEPSFDVGAVCELLERLTEQAHLILAGGGVGHEPQPGYLHSGASRGACNKRGEKDEIRWLSQS